VDGHRRPDAAVDVSARCDLTQLEFVMGDLIRPNRSSALRMSCKRRRSDRAVRSLSERAVAEVYDAVSESALIEELEVGAYAGRQPWLAPADDNGPHEQLALVDQPGLESLRREVGTSYGEIAAGRGLQFVYCGGVETAFESGVGS
jgi:hypothetical protein